MLASYLVLQINCNPFLPTTYVIRGKVMFSQLSVILFRRGRVPPVQVLSRGCGGGGGFKVPSTPSTLARSGLTLIKVCLHVTFACVSPCDANNVFQHTKWSVYTWHLHLRVTHRMGWEPILCICITIHTMLKVDADADADANVTCKHSLRVVGIAS